MKLYWNWKIAAGVVAGPILLGALLLPILSRESNCGGNSASLSRCSFLNGYLQLWFAERSDGFDVAKHGWKELEMDTRSFFGWGSAPENYLLKKQIASFPGGSGIVAVCNLEFGNVPQPTIWNGYRRTPGHAALLADGTTKVISPAEFAALDLKQFVPLSSLKGFEKTTAKAPQLDQ